MTVKKKKIIKIVVCLLAVISVIAAILMFTGYAQRIWLSVLPNGTVSDSLLDVDESEHITDIPKGEIRYLINKNAMFDNSFAMGTIMLENPVSSEYDLVFQICTSDGAQIYLSPTLKAGQSIKDDRLSDYVKTGTYECVYYARAYQNGEYCGEVSGELKVTVG